MDCQCKQSEHTLRQLHHLTFPHPRDVVALELLLVHRFLRHHDLLPAAEVGAALPQPARLRDAHGAEEGGGGAEGPPAPPHGLLSPEPTTRPLTPT